MVKSEVASGGSYNYAASCGIPSVLLERGGMGAWETEEVRSINVMCAVFYGFLESMTDIEVCENIIH